MGSRFFAQCQKIKVHADIQKQQSETIVIRKRVFFFFMTMVRHMFVEVLVGCFRRCSSSYSLITSYGENQENIGWKSGKENYLQWCLIDQSWYKHLYSCQWNSIKWGEISFGQKQPMEVFCICQKANIWHDIGG